MSDQNIIITDPAQWRAGDRVTIEGTLVSAGEGHDVTTALRLGKNGLFVRSELTGGLAIGLQANSTTVTVRRPAPPLPDKPGDVFYATVDDTPNVQVTALMGVPNRFFCVFPSGTNGTRAGNSIDPSTVRRVRLVPEDEQ